MAMGIVSDDEFEKELTKLIPSKSHRTIDVEAIVVDKAPVGRGEGNVEVPNIVREIIGTEAIEGSRAGALDIAKRYGISASSVSAYTKGATSTASYDKPTKELGSAISSAKDRVVKRARNRMMMALDAITPEKLEASKARDAASVAKDMSAIIRNLEPPAPVGPINTGPQFVLYAPQFIQEEKLEVIQVND